MLIAQALGQDTPYILLDEPTSHLDLAHRIEILLLLKKLAGQKNKGIMLSTHDLHHSIQVAHKIWMINQHGHMHTGIPEDCLLDGVFENYFKIDPAKYNFGSGFLKFPVDPSAVKIQVQGSDIRAKWTKQAMVRMGFALTNDAINTIIVEKDSWVVKTENHQQSFSNLESVLGYLQSTF